ncbi:MAG: ribonucleotide-diphosphate reductase subunit beta [Castellaniella sp.]
MTSSANLLDTSVNVESTIDSPAAPSLSAIEPIPEDTRLTALPIGRQETWEWYLKSVNCFWVPQDIDFSQDPEDYENSPKMTDDMRRFIDYVMAFFASLDQLVNVNILERFLKDFPILEVEFFYNFQTMMENIHAHTYSLQIDTIIRDPAKREHLLKSIETIPVIKRMGSWITDTADSQEGIGRRLLRMVAVEGIFFIGAFCAIYWIGSFGLMKGLVQANELIQRDESLHTEFAIHLYSMLRPEHQLSDGEIHELMRDAMEIANEFVAEAIPFDMLSMNQRLMTQYLECQVDGLLTLLGVPLLYGSTNPFGFMEMINMPNKTNFFEKRVTEYGRKSDIIPAQAKGKDEFAADDF